MIDIQTIDGRGQSGQSASQSVSGLQVSSKSAASQETDQVTGQVTGHVVDKPTESTLKSTLKGTRKLVFELIEGNPNITLDQIAEQLGLNPRGIDKHVKNLKAMGLLDLVDGDNGGHWVIIEG